MLQKPFFKIINFIFIVPIVIPAIKIIKINFEKKKHLLLFVPFINDVVFAALARIYVRDETTKNYVHFYRPHTIGMLVGWFINDFVIYTYIFTKHRRAFAKALIFSDWLLHVKYLLMEWFSIRYYIYNVLNLFPAFLSFIQYSLEKIFCRLSFEHLNQRENLFEHYKIIVIVFYLWRYISLLLPSIKLFFKFFSNNGVLIIRLKLKFEFVRKKFMYSFFNNYIRRNSKKFKYKKENLQEFEGEFKVKKFKRYFRKHGRKTYKELW